MTGCLVTEPVAGAVHAAGGRVAAHVTAEAVAHLVRAGVDSIEHVLGEPFDQPGQPVTLVTYEDDPQDRDRSSLRSQRRIGASLWRHRPTSVAQTQRGTQPSAGCPVTVLDRQIGWMSAWGPLVPWLAVYSTRWLSWRLR